MDKRVINVTEDCLLTGLEIYEPNERHPDEETFSCFVTDKDGNLMGMMCSTTAPIIDDREVEVGGMADDQYAVFILSHVKRLQLLHALLNKRKELWEEKQKPLRESIKEVAHIINHRYKLCEYILHPDGTKENRPNPYGEYAHRCLSAALDDMERLWCAEGYTGLLLYDNWTNSVVKVLGEFPEEFRPVKG